MKVIGINSSPRIKANTQTLIEAALDGAMRKGAETRIVNLRQLKINGCIGCGGCRKHYGKCSQKDDLTLLLQEMTTFDGIILGTPIYWYHVTSQLKMLVDRLYSFIEVRENPKTGAQAFISHFPPGKQLVIILSRGEPDPPPIPFPQVYDHLNEWLTIIPQALQIEHYEFFYQYGSHSDRKAAQNDTELLKKARQTGAGLL